MVVVVMVVMMVVGMWRRCNSPGNTNQRKANGTTRTTAHVDILLFVLSPVSLFQVENAYQQHLMRGEATEELLQMGQTNAALDILAQK